ncbi:MAG: LysM peptidoglycan-binding domain-containing protein [Anaerolineae bacterium]|nr:LysM peptidoglycan-binding domain-containing protein [Anaerolineae bacterium]
MSSSSRWRAIRRGIRSRGRELALIVILLLVNYLILSRLLVAVSGNRQATPTPTRTPKPTFTPFDVVLATSTPVSEASPTEQAAPVASPTASVHVVQAGETLSEIARTYSTTVDAIVQANDLGSADAIINDGQELVIPPASPPLPEGDATVVPVPTSSSQAGRRIHVVQQGETLSEIARTYGVSAEQLAQANGLDDPNAISVGQALVIP